MLRYIVLIIITAFVMTGCATVNRGADDHFRIDTVPQGAKITTDIETPQSRRNKRKNKNSPPEYYGCDPTPCAIQLSRLSEFTFIVEHVGYEPVEMYVSSSNKRGSLTANTAASVAATAGTVAAGAAATSATIAVSLGITTATAAGTGAAFTFGLIPIETAVSTGFAAGVGAAPSTASLIAGAVPPALAISGGMMLIDAGTGANKNIYPNPVVLELAPKGSQVKYDPAVNLFKRKKSAEDTYENKCRKKKSAQRTYSRSDECKILRTEMRDARRALKEVTTPAKKSEQSKLDAESSAPK